MLLRSRLSLVVGGILVCLQWWSAPASACDFSGPAHLQVIANPSDQTPPVVPTVSVVGFRRGDDVNGPGCDPGHCTHIPLLTLKVSSSDETSAASQLGYELVQIGGQPLADDKGVVVPDADGRLALLFAGNQSGSDDFDLQVSAVDPAGNVSGSTTVHVRVDGDGCQLAETIQGGALWMTVMLLALATRQHYVSGREANKPLPRRQFP